MRHASKLFLILALNLTGCVSFTRGLQKLQQGLAIIDQATEKSAEGLLNAVKTVRQFCELSEDADKCMDDLGITQQMLDAVCVPDESGACIAGAAAKLDRAYQDAAQAAKMADEAWSQLKPQLEAAEAAAKQVKDGLGQ